MSAHVLELIQQQIPMQDAGFFLRIPVKPRVKTDSSLLQKAFIRKAYSNPYDDIEDKVGVRFVVLLSEDVRLVGGSIEVSDAWTVEKSRDGEAERKANPSTFGYQSLHYVVRCKNRIVFDGVTIPENIPCEIQVRTLLQHAYSELTHDTIYKPSVSTTPSMVRAAAKSMALIEATDDYFSQVVELIRDSGKEYQLIEELVFSRYREITGKNPVTSPLNTAIIDHYKEILDSEFKVKFENWLERKPYVKDALQERSPVDILYDVPAVLLLMYVVSEKPESAKLGSPLTDDELAPIYSLFGHALHG
ncbi:GTP pyrophosphokinase [Agrobacterium rubi]|uniref:GTP pyrophosphokinase n=1 Tax=Agrobacterium rubi TaxID=28099 RepID=UPI00103B8CD3|nr:RelA/SpoT domain-containing protein [Agrobacterium rubi]MBP1879144.1 ppGpp synthetase/RelA/SpoT-type nucleotidyltransferase [Agrobacterium rubi]